MHDYYNGDLGVTMGASTRSTKPIHIPNDLEEIEISADAMRAMIRDKGFDERQYRRLVAGWGAYTPDDGSGKYYIVPLGGRAPVTPRKRIDTTTDAKAAAWAEVERQAAPLLSGDRPMPRATRPTEAQGNAIADLVEQMLYGDVYRGKRA